MITPEPLLLALMKASKRAERQISEMVFVAGYSAYFSDKVDLLYEIKQCVSLEFSTPIHQILICGSAHVGCSVHKDTLFEPGSSDLDLAIISPSLYSRLLSEVIIETDSYTDLRLFERRRGVSVKDEFVRYAAERGMIRPDLLPRISSKARWFDFFNEVSSKYLAHFKKISAAVYISEACFASKQVPSILVARKGAV